jgi:heterodisulfide reductase subunit C
MAAQTVLNTEECYQCQKCSAGCPVSEFMDYKPHQVIQMMNLRMTDLLLSSRTIWVCASCYTCTTRCPNEVNVAGAMDLLRQTALSGSRPTAEARTVLFHNEFLQNVRTFGRIHELSMIARYKMATKTYSADMRLGLAMFLKGKLRVLPSLMKGRKQVSVLFPKVNR